MDEKYNKMKESIESIKLPDSALRVAFEEYKEMLKKTNFPLYEKFIGKWKSDSTFSESILNEINTSILAATLILTLEDDIDISKIWTEKKDDLILANLRREFVGRAILLNRDVPKNIGLSAKIIKQRVKYFISLVSE